MHRGAPDFSTVDVEHFHLWSTIRTNRHSPIASGMGKIISLFSNWPEWIAGAVAGAVAGAMVGLIVGSIAGFINRSAAPEFSRSHNWSSNRSISRICIVGVNRDIDSWIWIRITSRFTHGSISRRVGGIFDRRVYRRNTVRICR
jgi:hypothetical protein